MKPRARNIPYSYVLPSTSASIRESTSMEARMAKKMIVDMNVALRKSWIKAVILYCL